MGMMLRSCFLLRLKGVVLQKKVAVASMAAEIPLAALNLVLWWDDDDLPPPHQNRFARNARVVRNGRSAVSAPAPLRRMSNNAMETQIRMIEQDAYFSVLPGAFKAHSDAIS